MKKIAFYGGSFDPVHNGHLAIAQKLSGLFALSEFWFIPAFHAPHKKDKKVTSSFCRYAMLALATNRDANIKISTIELNSPEKPFTFETQAKLKNEMPEAEIFFVIGADSWNDIGSWREWQKVLTQTNIIVVTRPGYEIEFAHVTDEIREKVIDLRGKNAADFSSALSERENKNRKSETAIYITDAVQMDISATEIRQKIRDGIGDWREDVSPEVAKYIEKYKLYI